MALGIVMIFGSHKSLSDFRRMSRVARETKGRPHIHGELFARLVPFDSRTTRSSRFITRERFILVEQGMSLSQPLGGGH